jgi:hypothetical protein
MKKFLKISLIAALVLMSAGLYANEDDFSFKLRRVSEKSISFFMNEAQSVDVSIYGADYEVLYEQTIMALGASTKTFDLNAFPDGTYIFKMVTESKSAEYIILISKGEAVVSDPVITETFKPVLTKEKGIVTLNLLNAPKGAVEIQVLDEYNDEVYNKVFAGASKFTKRFNVARVAVKELTFIIKADDQEFREVVQMR